jgi:hypothetical protein
VCCLLVLVGLTFAVRRYVIAHWVYLLTAILALKSEVQVSDRVKKWSIYLCLISIIFQLATIRFFDGRPTLSHIDTNYSGFYIFCFFAFAWKNGYRKIALIAGALGFLTLSRCYMLAMAAFFFVEYVPFFRKKIMSRFSFPVLLLSGYLALLLLGGYFLQRVSPEEGYKATHQTEKSRLLVFKDLSNVHRFMANQKFLDDFMEKPSKYFWGIDAKEYNKTVFLNTPHNGIFSLVVSYGLFFTFFYLLLLLKAFNRFYTPPNFPFFAGLLLYLLFLGGMLWGIQLIWIAFILKANNLNIENKLL